jgi:hypothetical protein
MVLLMCVGCLGIGFGMYVFECLIFKSKKQKQRKTQRNNFFPSFLSTAISPKSSLVIRDRHFKIFKVQVCHFPLS